MLWSELLLYWGFNYPWVKSNPQYQPLVGWCTTSKLNQSLLGLFLDLQLTDLPGCLPIYFTRPHNHSWLRPKAVMSAPCLFSILLYFLDYNICLFVYLADKCIFECPLGSSSGLTKIILHYILQHAAILTVFLRVSTWCWSEYHYYYHYYYYFMVGFTSLTLKVRKWGL